MTFLLDVNVLIALAWPRHVHHAVVTQWFVGAHGQGWATTPVTEAGFIRVSSNPRIFPDGASPGQAAAMLARLQEVNGHRFWKDSTKLGGYAHIFSEHVHGYGSVTDAHLALLARANDGTLATLDSGAAAIATSLGTQSVVLIA